MDNDNVIFAFLTIIIIIVIIYFIILLLSKYSNINVVDSEMHSYYVDTIIKDDGKNMNYCLPGCIRGICNKNKINNSCKHDYQCQYCQDKVTNMFYVDL